MNAELGASLLDLLKEWGASDVSASIIRSVVIFLGIVAVAYLANFFTKRVIISIVRRIIRKSKNTYDDVFIEEKVFNHLSHVVPALIIYFAIPLAFNSDHDYGVSFTRIESIIAVIRSMTYIYMIIVILIVLNAFLNALHKIYMKLPIGGTIDIKGYIQILKIIIVAVGVIFIISIILDKRPGALLAGLGGMVAILLLVFKDTILGFVASIQLSANKMLKKGDWITMPSRGADGDVIDISINTVKVQNFDKTVSTIPTYALVSESFTNWRGMQESGGRRIKRSINIDMKSVKFCTPEMIARYKKIQHLKDYIENKEEELSSHNAAQGIDDAVLVNGRRMTNIGTFRKYIEHYLEKHPRRNTELTFLIRQLKPTEMGLPIEIYMFANTTNWGEYEAIQADIFDHILAVIPEFDLRIFQNPTGEDFHRLTGYTDN